jgi:hypothetical protein
MKDSLSTNGLMASTASIKQQLKTIAEAQKASSKVLAISSSVTNDSPNPLLSKWYACKKEGMALRLLSFG